MGYWRRRLVEGEMAVDDGLLKAAPRTKEGYGTTDIADKLLE